MASQDTHRDVSLLQQRSHPNVVKVTLFEMASEHVTIFKYVDSFTDRSISGSDRGLYIVMELVVMGLRF